LQDIHALRTGSNSADKHRPVIARETTTGPVLPWRPRAAGSLAAEASARMAYHNSIRSWWPVNFQDLAAHRAYCDSGLGAFEPMLFCKPAQGPTTISAFCWRITRHNALAARADLYPQWLVRDLLPLPPNGGIPRETTRSLNQPSSADAAGQAAGRSFWCSKIAIKAAVVADLESSNRRSHGSNWHLHPRRRWLVHRHH
jgi:hypothetical protein